MNIEYEPLLYGRTRESARARIRGIRGAVEVAKMKVTLAVECLDAGGNVSMQFTEQFDLVVVGAGHAGCEAAVAASI